jgi:adenylate cyclase class 2
MQTEIEVKFLNVNHDEIRAKLQKLGATLEKPMRLMRRTMFDFEDDRLHKAWSHFRVRDEGDKVTMTLKHHDKTTALHAQSVKEIETVVGDYETTVGIFKALGMVVKSEQDTKRETWRFKNSEIMLDEWPWIKPFIEIEGPTEEEIRDIAKLLGFDWETQAAFGASTTAYRAEYDFPKDKSIGSWAEVRFDLPVPPDLAKGKRSKE